MGEIGFDHQVELAVGAFKQGFPVVVLVVVGLVQELGSQQLGCNGLLTKLLIIALSRQLNSLPGSLPRKIEFLIQIVLR